MEEEWLRFWRNEQYFFKETDDEDEDGDGIGNADGRWKKIWGEMKEKGEVEKEGKKNEKRK